MENEITFVEFVVSEQMRKFIDICSTFQKNKDIIFTVTLGDGFKNKDATLRGSQQDNDKYIEMKCYVQINDLPEEVLSKLDENTTLQSFFDLLKSNGLVN